MAFNMFHACLRGTGNQTQDLLARWGKALRQLSYSSMGPICEVHGAKHTVLGTVVHTLGIQKVCAEWKN